MLGAHHDDRVGPVSADQVQVEVRHDPVERHRGVVHVIVAAPEPSLLPAGHEEQQRPSRPGRGVGEGFGDRQQRGQPGGVVVRAVVDAVRRPGANADVVHVRGDRDVFLPEDRIATFHRRDEVRRQVAGQHPPHQADARASHLAGIAAAQGAPVHFQHRRPIPRQPEIGPEPGPCRRGEAAGEGGRVAIGDDDDREGLPGDLFHPLLEVGCERARKIHRQEDDPAPKAGIRGRGRRQRAVEQHRLAGDLGPADGSPT